MAIKKKTTTTKRKTAKSSPVVKVNVSTTSQKKSGFLDGFNREDNIHMLFGIILLVIGLYQLRTRLLGLVFIIVGILFVTGHFEKGRRK